MPHDIFSSANIARYANMVDDANEPSDTITTLKKKENSNQKMLRRIGLPVLIGGNLADAITTNINYGNPNIRETNPIFNKMNRTGMNALWAAEVAGGSYLLDKMAKKHPKLAMAIALGMGGLGTGLSINNAKLTRYYSRMKK